MSRKLNEKLVKKCVCLNLKTLNISVTKSGKICSKISLMSEYFRDEQLCVGDIFYYIKNADFEINNLN